MRSAAISVVVVLMVLRTAAYPATTTETTIVPTTSCQIVTCHPNCYYMEGFDGCLSCSCPPTCADIDCAEYEECIPQEYDCDGNFCHYWPTCVQRTTTVPPCEDMSWCVGSCNLDWSSSNGCPSCICYDTPCMFASCGGDEQCVDNYECPDGQCYSCVPLYETTIEPNKDCPNPECGPFCANRKTGSDGCPTCDCYADEACQHVECAEDEECIPTADYCNEDTCFYLPTCTLKTEP